MRASLLLVASSLLAWSLLACSSSSSPAPTSSAPPASSSASGGPVSEGGADTWTSYASGFVTSYCVECHDASDATGRDFDVEANVQKERNAIRCGVAIAQDPSWGCATFPPAKQFPIGSGPKPSDAERARFVAWIGAGAP